MKISSGIVLASLFATAVNGFQVHSPSRIVGLSSKKSNLSLVNSFPSSISINENNLSIRGGSILQAATTSSDTQTELDVEAISKYTVALATQLSLISGFFYGIDTILPIVTDGAMTTLPTPVTWLMCYAFSLKSRAFNPLNNARPDRSKAVKGGKSDGFMDRQQPSWTPPGVVFPIMWLLIIGPLRATSSTMIINAMGSYFTLPLMSLMLHLSCGDIWNTINNTEKRYGTAVLGIGTVYVSALHAAYQYYQVDPLAGKLLGATAIWLTIAGTLIFEIWRMNPNANGEKASILPTKTVGEPSVTTFAWGAKKE